MSFVTVLKGYPLRSFRTAGFKKKDIKMTLVWDESAGTKTNFEIRYSEGSSIVIRYIFLLFLLCDVSSIILFLLLKLPFLR